MQIAAEEWRTITHKQRRTLINKERRRRKRQKNAIERENEERAAQTQLESEPGYHERLAETERLKAEKEQEEEAKRLLDHEAWLDRERVAAEEYRKKKELDDKRKRDKEERERLIREEWEALQTRERQVEEKRERNRREKEERLKEALNVDSEPTVQEYSQPWHNPLAPPTTTDANFGTEKDTRNCAFFLKTGACRFGDRCSKQHPHPSTSVTLLIPGMFESLGLKELMLDERDQDTALEYDEGEQFAQFEAFFRDALPEFSKAGKVVQFKVSCNHEPHLRGNVYVQYSSEKECADALSMFNGRWYAQRQLSCEYCPVQKWKTAICGLFERGRCPKGKHCNFLHVFRNPGGAFARADRDLPASSERSEERTTPERKRHRSHSRDSGDSPHGKHRSHSRESRGSSRDVHRSHSKGSSRDVRRSHSRGSSRDVRRSHSRGSSRDEHRSHSRESTQKEHRSHKETSHKRHKKKHKHKYSSSPSDTPLLTNTAEQGGQTAASAVAVSQSTLAI